MLAIGRLRRAWIVTVYVAVFWLALPLLLWRAARFLDPRLRMPAGSAVAGWALAGCGLALMLAAMSALWRQGGGLPVSLLPPRRLVVRGPYRYVRHPIYLGFNLALAGAGMALASPALTWVVAPLFAPAWMAYAAVEERSLLRRFGDDYRYYRRHVGLLPRVVLYNLARLPAALFPLTVVGRERIPGKGGAVLVANHACYLDPAFIGRATWRCVCFSTTAEVFRRRLPGAVLRRLHAFPVRRYRSDPASCRHLLFLLRSGALVGVFCEGERSAWGDYRGARPEVAALLRRLPFPVIPVGLSGNYDSGPRWSDVLRRRRVRVAVGAPLALGGSPAEAIDRALRGLLGADPQPLRLRGLPRRHLQRILWRCPRCQDEGQWRPWELACGRCGERFLETPGGLFAGADRRPVALAELGRRQFAAAEEETLSMSAEGWHEADVHGPLGPLRRLGGGTLTVGRDGIRFGPLAIAAGDLRSVSIERADTLQVAAGGAMWQFRVAAGSAFRAQRALEGWRRTAAGGAP